jgi:type II secretory pathway pseudopilin PulG
MMSRRPLPNVAAALWNARAAAPLSTDDFASYNRQRRSAFTLIEVLLAVSIIIGLLVVVLFFYQQAAQLRTELLTDTERSSAARLLMDKLTAELRAARAHTFYEVPLVGDSTYLQFIATDLPSDTAWTGERLGRITRPESDLKLVRYSTETESSTTNILGLARAEEPLIELRKVAGSELLIGPSVSETNNSASVLITDQFHFIHFRYWDGAAWVDSWNNTWLPSGVEISLGREPLPAEMETADYPYEVFRRVVYLPGSATSEEELDFDVFAEVSK